MNRFADVLKQARERLEVPEPSRTRILLEMASDLEDSYQYHLSQGRDGPEAIRRAEEAFGTSDEALGHLARIHQGSVGGLADRVSGQAGRVWEKVLLVALLAFEVLLAIKVLSDEAFFVYVSPFVWPIAGLALAAFAFASWKLFQIFSKSNRDTRQLRSGLSVLLFLSGASLAIASGGFLFHLQRFFRLNADQAPESLFMNLAGWMIQIASMMTVGLLTAILTALLWFVLSNVVARSERREIESLLTS